MWRVKVGLLGCGTVGRGFVALVDRERERIKARYGADVEVARILVRDPDKPRAGIDPALLTTRATDVIDDGCDVIVELVGGVHCAGAYVRRALEQRHPVVTANKALLEQKLRILAELAFDAPVLRSDVMPLRGIDGEAVRNAMQGGGALRYVASATRIGGGVSIKVAPEVLDADDPLARVRDENNAVIIRGEAVGDLLLAGRGAGAMPTAAAVLGDVLEEVSLNLT